MCNLFDFSHFNDKHTVLIVPNVRVVCVYEYCLSYNCRKLSDGLFLRECAAVSEGYPSIEFNSMIIDNCCMQVSVHDLPHESGCKLYVV